MTTWQCREHIIITLSIFPSPLIEKSTLAVSHQQTCLRRLYHFLCLLVCVCVFFSEYLTCCHFSDFFFDLFTWVYKWALRFLPDLYFSPLSLSANTIGIINVAPTVDMIENLGMENVYWTAAHLNMMSNDTFLTCVETLGAIPGYNTDQLSVLIKKATEVQWRQWRLDLFIQGPQDSAVIAELFSHMFWFVFVHYSPMCHNNFTW